MDEAVNSMIVNLGESSDCMPTYEGEICSSSEGK